jgi:hypothetical protein
MLWDSDYPCGVSAGDLARLLEMADARWGDGVGLGVWAPSRAADVRLRAWWARFQRAAASPGMVHSLLALYPDIDIRDVLEPSVFPRWCCTAATTA